MSLPSFYEENITQAAGNFILSEETTKHCIQVLRMHTGEQLALTNGKGNIYTAAIAKEDKRNCVVTIQGVTHTPKAARHITIAMSLLKNANRFEWFLEKAVEIGVGEIIPLISNRTERQHFRYDRMHNIVVAAMLQSNQAWLPVLHQPTMFDKVLRNQHAQKLIAHCEDGEKQTVLEVPATNDVIILIGPEGDFSLDEINVATQQGYIPVTLGSTRLRTETAGVVAATLLANKA
jgi:16S rRNA (uracil1498-N3)-methyltransferase